MAIKKLKLQKNITLFYFEKIEISVVDELFQFCQSNKDVLISMLQFDMVNNEPYKILIGLNIAGGVVEHELKSSKFYYFQGSELCSCDDPETINWW